jgi:hypothetical protein
LRIMSLITATMSMITILQPNITTEDKYPNSCNTCSVGNIQVQGDQKVSVHLMFTIQEITWLNLTVWQPTARARLTLDSH